ncbi:hypothetical protein CEXT_161671 [Caerostris extrusa]|uniref:Uncharacterized protein n=1 Tax=Caerostris extrusa TaxID=172846 RepID=A0AAV4MNF5_CAEEX|nr:hypothetical protein CEXT_161671 [Caerostris extrusa]
MHYLLRPSQSESGAASAPMRTGTSDWPDHLHPWGNRFAVNASGHALAVVVHSCKYNCGGNNCRNFGNCVTEMCGDL